MKDVLTNKQRRMLALLTGERGADWRTPQETADVLNARLPQGERKAGVFSRQFVVKTVSAAGSLAPLFMGRPDPTPGSSEFEYRLNDVGRIMANECALVVKAKSRTAKPR